MSFSASSSFSDCTTDNENRRGDYHTQCSTKVCVSATRAVVCMESLVKREHAGLVSTITDGDTILNTLSTSFLDAAPPGGPTEDSDIVNSPRLTTCSKRGTADTATSGEKERLRASRGHHADLVFSDFEDITTPGSTPRLSQAGELLPLQHYHEDGEPIWTSVPSEKVIVNAEAAQQVHNSLKQFSATTMLTYRLLKLKVQQRIYRLYYDKWLQGQTAPTIQRCSHETQTPPQLPTQVGTPSNDFLEIASYHSCQTPSPQISPLAIRQKTVEDRGSDPSPPLFCTSLSPHKSIVSTMPNAMTNGSSCKVERHGAAASAVSFESIAARTRPSMLVDYGTPSEIPRRKTRSPARGPSIDIPAVVPLPLRIYRV